MKFSHVCSLRSTEIVAACFDHDLSGDADRYYPAPLVAQARQVMKVAEADILIIPGYLGSGPDHWQSRWQSKLSTARRIEQADWERPRKDDWCARIVKAAEEAERPAVIVAHSLGVPSVVHAAASLPIGVVRAAFLVAYVDVENNTGIPGLDPAFAPIPRDPLPFPSLLIASRTDPYCMYEVAEDLSYAWGARLVDAGDAGHINAASGRGPWPEGGLTFAQFLSRL